MSRKPPTAIEPDRNDQKYFVVTPHLVWVVSRGPYDLAFWTVVKMVAGDTGVCTLSAEEMAQACGMSVGKVVDCRTYLIAQGLLVGEIARDEAGQSTWRLRIPDLWPRNIAWRSQAGNSLRERIQARADFHRDAQKPSPHEGKPSPHEGKPSPHEGKPSPHEGFQSSLHHIENQQEEPIRKTNKENDDDARVRENGSSSSFSTWDQLIDTFGQDEVTEAVKLAKTRGTDLRYVAGVLRNRAKQGKAPRARGGTGRRDPFAW